MRIWYIHPYGGGPGVGVYNRPYGLARAWRTLGPSATIFISRYHHQLERAAPLEAEFDLGGVRYVTVPARAYSGNGPGRILNMLDFVRNLGRAAREQAEQGSLPHAIVYSSPHPFGIYPAHRLARRFGAKLVFEIRDLWPLSVTELLGVPRWHPFVRICAAAEHFALSRADLISSVLPRVEGYLQNRRQVRKPYVWVPNGVGLEDTNRNIGYASQAGHLAAVRVREWRAAGKVIVGYLGSVGVPNAIDLLVDAAALSKKSADGTGPKFVIAGTGTEFEKLRSHARRNNLDDTVYFAGQLPKQDARNLAREIDIGYAGLKATPKLFQYGISPNKIIDYFEAALPVLLPISPCGDPVSMSNGGIATAARAPEDVWRALSDLVALPAGQRRAMGERGKSYIEAQYNYDVIAARYLDAIEKL